MKATTQLEHSTMVKGPSGTLYVTDGGSGTIPVIFLHSFGGSSEHWKTQLDHVREFTRGIAFDFRGHGKSSPPADNNYTAESLAADLAAVVDHFALDHVVLVGHSMGGAAAICYAGMHPERVAGLVLAGTPGKSQEAVAKPIIESLESPEYGQVMDQYMKQLTTGTSEAWRKRLEADTKKLSRETSIKVIKSMFAFDPLPALKKYSGPKLIISTTGEDQQPTSLHNQVPGIPHHTFEGTSHWTMLDKPEEFNQLLDDFLRDIKP